MMRQFAAAALVCATVIPSVPLAQDVRITEDLPSASFTLNGQSIVIERNQDQANVISGEYAKTSRPCPPFCIAPMSVAEGVTTVGELEVIDFLRDHVADGTGLLIDSRVPQWYEKGTIPGAVNVPFPTLESDNPYRTDILKALGAREIGGQLDFSDALRLTVFCNGPWCEQAPRAIRNLLESGYPAENIQYYRGGMQLWLTFGMTVELPQSQG